ncbi:MAG: Holliday junction resolvase RuvX [Deltaproteobacteria bacterium]|nr:Holliday junction resolvase RuvX [Deltaproteobacteria bacterium]
MHKKQRILALDVGTKRIGVAITDELGYTAQPLVVISKEGDEKAIEEIKKIVIKYNVGKIVIGLPFTLRDRIGKMAERVLRFADKLKSNLEIPIVTWDESFTTTEAEDILIKADLSRKRRREIKDKIAASFILESYLRENR